MRKDGDALVGLYSVQPISDRVGYVDVQKMVLHGDWNRNGAGFDGSQGGRVIEGDGSFVPGAADAKDIDGTPRTCRVDPDDHGGFGDVAAVRSRRQVSKIETNVSVGSRTHAQDDLRAVVGGWRQRGCRGIVADDLRTQNCWTQTAQNQNGN